MTIDPASTVRRVRHEGARRRVLTVKHRKQLSEDLVRFTLTGDLDGFVSLGFDDHIKLFFDTPTGPAGRDYTPRHFDAAASELDIEFAINHAAGPATAWARSAEPGATLNLGGPRGSFVIEDRLDWYALIGDETALPAIGRRLGELRAGVPVIAILQARQVILETKTDLRLTWLGEGESAHDAVRRQGLPGGQGHVWIAGESAWAKSLRTLMVDELGHPPELIRAAAYWRRGDAGVHEVLG